MLIQKRPAVDEVDASHAPTETWTTLRQTWMSKSDVGGNERFQAQQLSAYYDTQWELPYTADMDPDLLDISKLRRLVYQNRVYDIVLAQMVGRRTGLVLMTVSGGTYQ